MHRRDFLRTAAGKAAGFGALNIVGRATVVGPVATVRTTYERFIYLLVKSSILLRTR